jgi:hypothetical protein
VHRVPSEVTGGGPTEATICLECPGSGDIRHVHAVTIAGAGRRVVLATAATVAPMRERS